MPKAAIGRHGPRQGRLRASERLGWNEVGGVPMHAAQNAAVRASFAVLDYSKGWDWGLNETSQNLLPTPRPGGSLKPSQEPWEATDAFCCSQSGPCGWA